MTIQETIVNLLEVENDIKTYPQVMPDDGTTVLPCVVYQRISTRQFRHMEGNGLERPIIQLSIWAENYADCVATATQVKALMDLNQTDFELAYKDNELEPDIPDESGLYRIVLDFIILWKEI